MAGLKISFEKMAVDTVEKSSHGGHFRVAHISINNPEAGQSFGETEAEDLLEFCKQIVKPGKSKDRSSVVGVIWSNANAIWCSGGNLKNYAGQKKRLEGIATNRKIAKALKEFARLPVLTVATLTGDAFGGGVELLSAFDFAIAAPHVYMGLWQRRIGLTFGWGGGLRLKARLGRKTLLQEALLARNISAYEAADIGLLDEVLLSRLHHNRAIELISRHAKLPQAPVADLKDWDSKGETKIFEKIWMNPDHSAVLKKFTQEN